MLRLPRTQRICRAVIIIGALVIAPAGCTNPRQLAYVNEQMSQAADAVGEIRVNLSLLQSSIDSLKLVIAKQDSTIARLAAATNVTIVK